MYILFSVGDFFVVEWNQVVLRHQVDAGNFTFQVSLHKNGDIWFAYKNVRLFHTLDFVKILSLYLTFRFPSK